MRFVGASVLLVLSACATAQERVDGGVAVGDRADDQQRWDGVEVSVVGWLTSSCDDYERTCALHSLSKGSGDSNQTIFFKPTDEDRGPLRGLIGSKVQVRGKFNSCTSSGEFTSNADGTSTMTICVKHLTEARLENPNQDLN